MPLLEERTISQTLFRSPPRELRVICWRGPLGATILDNFRRSLPLRGFMGIAARYSKHHNIKKLAFASETQVLILEDIPTATPNPSHSRKSARNPLETLLLGSDRKFAFYMVQIVLSLHMDHKLRLSAGIDLLSLHAKPASVDAFLHALGGTEYAPHIFPDAARSFLRTLDSLNKVPADKSTDIFALEAWASFRGAQVCHAESKEPSIDTSSMLAVRLKLLSRIHRVQHQLDILKPTETKNDVMLCAVKKPDGKVELLCERFKTRLMVSSQKQHLEMEVEDHKGKRASVRTRVTRVKGRKAEIGNSSVASSSVIRKVTTVGRDDPTNAEQVKFTIILGILQGRLSIMQSPYFRSIFAEIGPASWTDTPVANTSPYSFEDYPGRPLNTSQTAAVKAILSAADRDRVFLVHGPPGTGKTTVIAASSIMAVKSCPSHTVWIVAQSNVAVKNVAEKLASLNFLDFKVLVSKEFHFDWHEHLYDAIEKNVIRSDQFKADDLSMARTLNGSRVILCTLSMLSKDSPKMGVITRIVPVQMVIVDEASQIEVGAYFAPIHLYSRTLRKMVFIGDDKQLPPYGESDIKEMQSIFEMKHLRRRALLLDTQYRMPVPIGTFISKQVYNGLLKTVHSIVSPMCCRFIDVGGVEAEKGKSWVNLREAQTVCRLARLLQAKGVSFKIITPYDPQRGILEDSLKAERLDWEDKCFNVDSFQGNEEDFIIISVVRTQRLGFLSDRKRMNVMLTRCKKGMFICTNRNFLEGVASGSLVGKLAKDVGPSAWVKYQTVLNMKTGQTNALHATLKL